MGGRRRAHGPGLGLGLGYSRLPVAAATRPFTFPRELRARFRDPEPLGVGGMGAVFKALDTRLDRTVAVKVMLRTASQAAAVRRFLREATVMASVRHPAVLGVYDQGLTEEGCWLVLEYMDGGSIRDWCAGNVPGQPAPGEAEVMEAFLVALEGLRAMHAAGLVHRDVKPANLLRTREGRVVIADLGLVLTSETTRLTGTGELVGTAAYLAPELLAGASASPASDLYAWGAGLYECLEGRVPFSLEDLVALSQGQAVGLPLRRLRPDRGPGRLLGACLDPDPSRRPVEPARFEALLGSTDPARAQGGEPSPPGSGAGRGGAPLSASSWSSPLSRSGTGARRIGPDARSPEEQTPADSGPPRSRGRTLAASAGLALALVAAFLGGRRLARPGDTAPSVADGSPADSRPAPTGSPARPRSGPGLEAIRELHRDHAGVVRILGGRTYQGHRDRVFAALAGSSGDLLWGHWLQAMEALTAEPRARLDPDLLEVSVLALVDRRIVGLQEVSDMWATPVVAMVAPPVDPEGPFGNLEVDRAVLSEAFSRLSIMRAGISRFLGSRERELVGLGPGGAALFAFLEGQIHPHRFTVANLSRWTPTGPDLAPPERGWNATLAAASIPRFEKEAGPSCQVLEAGLAAALDLARPVADELLPWRGAARDAFTVLVALQRGFSCLDEIEEAGAPLRPGAEAALLDSLAERADRLGNHLETEPGWVDLAATWGLYLIESPSAAPRNREPGADAVRRVLRGLRTRARSRILGED